MNYQEFRHLNKITLAQRISLWYILIMTLTKEEFKELFVPPLPEYGWQKELSVISLFHPMTINKWALGKASISPLNERYFRLISKALRERWM